MTDSFTPLLGPTQKRNTEEKSALSAWKKGTSKPDAHWAGKYGLGKLVLEWCRWLCIQVPKKAVSWLVYPSLLSLAMQLCPATEILPLAEKSRSPIWWELCLAWQSGSSCPCLPQWSCRGWAARSRSSANGARCSPDSRGVVTTLAGWSAVEEILEKQANCRVGACLMEGELIKSPARVGKC